MIRVIKDLFKYDTRFRLASVFLIIIIVMSGLSLVSPQDPGRTFQVPLDRPPSLQYVFGTNSRGQDIFWWMTFAIRNSLYLSIVTAVVSRIIALSVGMTAGYRGGAVDRVLMSVNDTFVVMPVLPILILLSFLLRGQMSLLTLGVMMGAFGWAFDARLIRSQVLSLRERSFTRTAEYCGAPTFHITIFEHLPFVLPIAFATLMNNMIWSIGMEVTLGVLGLSNVTLPTLGTTLYWANAHTALVAGVWWWLLSPVAVAVITFLGLYLLSQSVNEYIDPRTRLRLMGGS